MALTTIKQVGSQYDSLSSSDHWTLVLLKMWSHLVFEEAANHSSAIALYSSLLLWTHVYNIVVNVGGYLMMF